MRSNQNKPVKEREIAKERIEKLFCQAQDNFNETPLLSNRYVDLARKIAMKYKIKMRPSLRRRFCKHCHTFLVPGANCRIRTSEGHVTYLCKSCKKFMRFPYKREQKKRSDNKPKIT